ncbi:MAG: shikimate kinase [Ancalomicrobiaceae bacterium]|nr:shikimate kinase [Ancalomicrobiaceae bacterium]
MQVDKARPEDERLARIIAGLGRGSIVLVGMMGAGKTTIGKRLATRLGLRFIDADNEIERAAAQTIPEIFTEHGEAYFRDGERRVIARLLGEGPQVLATGGGAFMNADTRAAIAEKGISVWLEADVDLLFARVRRRSNRPLLENPDPEGTLRRLVAERHPVYALADIIVQSRDVPHDIMCDDVIAALVGHLDRPQQETSP